MPIQIVGILFVLLGAGVAHAEAETEARVREYFADTPVMIEIARCESKFRQYTDSGNPLYGGMGGAMVGVFQVHSTVHAAYAKNTLNYDVTTLEGNLGYAKYLYQTEGTDPWLSSANCWHAASTEPEPPIAVSPALSSVPASIQEIRPPFTMTLTLGMEHEEVRTLQKLLNGAGSIVATEGPGSPGQETTKFGALTLAAVRKFQCDKGIVCAGDDSYGVFGPRTREALLGTSQNLALSPRIDFAATSSPPFSQDEQAEISRLQAQITELTRILTDLLAKKSS